MPRTSTEARMRLTVERFIFGRTNQFLPLFPAQAGPNRDRVPADAKGRELQHGGRQGANREGHSVASKQMSLMTRTKNMRPASCKAAANSLASLAHKFMQ